MPDFSEEEADATRKRRALAEQHILELLDSAQLSIEESKVLLGRIKMRARRQELPDLPPT